MGLRERTERHQRGRHRDARGLHELGELLVGVRLHHAAADVEHRPLGLGDHLRRLRDLAVVRFRVRLVSRQVDHRRPGEIDLSVLDVLRDVHEHRARPPGGCDVKGSGDRPGNVFRLGHHEVVFGDWHGDSADVRLLERVGAQQRRANLAGDGHHRHGVQVRVGNRRHQVRGPGPGGGDADANLAGRDCVPLSCVARPLLVAHQHVPQLLGAKQRVVKRKHRAAG